MKPSNLFVTRMSFATALVARGDYSDALTWLDRAYEQRVPTLVLLSTSPSFDPLRTDPRFEALMKRIGLPDIHIA